MTPRDTLREALAALRRMGADVPGETPNARGWIEMKCPACADSEHHLGWRPESGSWKCWRCEVKRGGDILRALGGHHWAAGIPEAVIRLLIRGENGGEKPVSAPERRRPAAILPYGACALVGSAHLKYLSSRGYTPPNALAQKWGLWATGAVTQPAYRWRIVVLVEASDGAVVSWTARAIDTTRPDRWVSCPATDEAEPIKRQLYGAARAVSGRVVVVEGVPGVWRLGAGAVATFGTEWTVAQARALRRGWPRGVWVVFDPEPAAQRSAQRLASGLRAAGIPAQAVDLCREFGAADPGELSADEARVMMEELLCQEP